MKKYENWEKVLSTMHPGDFIVLPNSRLAYKFQQTVYHNRKNLRVSVKKQKDKTSHCYLLLRENK